MTVGAVPDVASVADRLAIHEVLVTHSRGVDRAHAETLKSAYWPDAEVEYGGFNGPAHEFCDMLPDSIRRFARTHHAIANVAIELRGDRAMVETYVTASHYHVDQEGDTEMTYLGRYLDRFEKRSGVWKIRHRRVVMDWNRNAPASAIFEGPPFDGLARGEWYPNDPLYRFLG